MPTPLYKIAAGAAAYAIPKTGSDGKLAASFIPDLSSIYQPLDGDLTALAALSSNGFAKRTGENTWSVGALAANDIPSLAASIITSGQLALARGGTNADLSATGGSNQFLKQSSAGGAVSVGAILSADLTSALTTPPAIGGTTPAGATFTSVTVSNAGVAFPLQVTSSGDNLNWQGGLYHTFRLADGTSPYGFYFGGFNASGNKIISMRFHGTPSSLQITGLGNDNWQFGERIQTQQGIIGAYHADLNIVLNQHTNGGANKGIRFKVNGGSAEAMVVEETGNVGIGAAIPSAKLTIVDTTAGSLSSVVNAVVIGRNDSGTPAAGFGAGLAFNLKTTTTNDQLAGRLRYDWTTSTHSSQSSKASLSIVSGGTERDQIVTQATQTAFYIGGSEVAKMNGNGLDVTAGTYTAFYIKGNIALQAANGDATNLTLGGGFTSLLINKPTTVLPSGNATGDAVRDIGTLTAVAGSNTPAVGFGGRLILQLPSYNGTYTNIDDGGASLLWKYISGDPTAATGKISLQLRPKHSLVGLAVNGQSDNSIRVGVGTESPNNALDVVGTIQADGLRLDLTPTAETITPTHTITVSINGTNYKIPMVAA